MASFIEKVLLEQSFSVDVARDGEHGERLALDKEYDVIVIDAMLPKKNGFALCAAIRKKRTPYQSSC